MGSFLFDTLFKSFSIKFVYFKIHDPNMAYYSKCTGREETSEKRDIKLLSFQICMVTNLSAAPSCFSLCSFCFWGEVSNSRILNDIGRNSLLGNRKKIAKFLMRTFTCRSNLLYGNSTPYCRHNTDLGYGHEQRKLSPSEKIDM
jgi:hypothetical protein